MNKRYKKNLEMVDEKRFYPLDEALDILLKQTAPKFDETVDIALRLGVDPKQADQNVRGTVALPHGIGKKIRVAVLWSYFGRRQRHQRQRRIKSFIYSCRSGCSFSGGKS